VDEQFLVNETEFAELVQEKLTRDLVVPIISARVCWLTFALTGSSLASLPKLAMSRSSRARRLMSVIPLKADIHQRGLHVR
jgi:hypothetical protein